jgi:hypothetical protein
MKILKLNSSAVILILVSMLISSCSMTFEKRRYRPGYHVEVVKKRNPSSIIDKNDVVDLNSNDVRPLPIQTVEESVLLTTTIVPFRINTKQKHNEKKVEKKLNIGRTTTGFGKWKSISNSKHPIRPLLKSNTTNGSNPIGKILGWTFGGLSIGFCIAGVICFIAVGGFAGIGLGAILMIVSALLVILALVFGLIKWKEPDATKPLKPGFVKGSFIFSIITLAVALIGFVFGFIVFPFGVVALSLASVAIPASIIAIGLGFAALKKDSSLKTKLIIIFAFVALILAVLAMILAFL